VDLRVSKWYFKTIIVLLNITGTLPIITGMNIRHRGRSKKTLTLYDAGGWYLLPILLGIPVVGVVLDYFWNYLVLFLGLRWLHITVSTKRKLIYCAIATGIGLLIDWLYYEITWGYLYLGNLRVPPMFARWGTEPVLEFSTILLPMAVLMAVNYAASRLYLRVNSKQAVVVGAIMGFFTAPWLIVVYVVFID